MNSWMYKTVTVEPSDNSDLFNFDLSAAPMAEGGDSLVNVYRNGLHLAASMVAIGADGTYVQITLPAGQESETGELWECVYPTAIGAAPTMASQGVAGRRLEDYNTALANLKQILQWETDPELTEAEVAFVLQSACVATVWQASTTYRQGDRVVPTVSTGQVYSPGVNADRTFGGTSDETEPDWPVGWRWPEARGDFWHGGDSRYVSDGTLRWEIVDAEPSSLWDMQRAAYDGWMMKAAKAVAYYQTSGDRGQTFMAQQVHDHCMLMARQYTPIGVA